MGESLSDVILQLQKLRLRERRALTQISDMPVSMVNDSESLRHSIKTMQSIARSALSEQRE